MGGNTRRHFLAGVAAGGAAQVFGPALLAGSASAAATKACVPTGPGRRVGAIAASPDGRTLWTADSEGRTITAHRRSDLTPGRSIDVGGAPIDIAISPDGRKALVTTAFYDHPGLAIVDLHSGQVDHVDAGNEPQAVLYAPNGRTAYVLGGGGHATLTHVNPRTGHVHAPVALGRHARGFAIAPDGKHALVAVNADSVIAVVELAKGRVTRRIKTAPFPAQVAIAPDGKSAIVTHNGFGSRRATSIDLVKWRAGHAIRTGLDPSGVAFDRSGRYALIANTGSSTVAVVDPRSGRRRRTIRFKGAPRHVAVSGTRGYIADGLTGRLTSIRMGVI